MRRVTLAVVGCQHEHEGIAITVRREQGGDRDRKTRVAKRRLEHDAGLLLAMTTASWLHSVPAQAQLQCSKLLCHQPEPDDAKVMIERVCEPNSRALHDRKAGGVDGGQLVQIRASKIFPRLFQVAQLAWKNPYRAGLVDSFLPCQRDIPTGVTIEKCECLDDYGNGTVKFRAHSAQQLPLLSRLRM